MPFDRHGRPCAGHPRLATPDGIADAPSPSRLRSARDHDRLPQQHGRLFMFKRIDHVEIVTDQPDRTVEFYTRLLGFAVRSRERIERPGGPAIDLVYLELGGTTVELITYDRTVAPAPVVEHLGYRMIALEVEAMDEALAFLKSKGVPCVWGPFLREGRYARAEITDPNGFHIELRQWF
jgi:glyoxylase I family protein